MKLELLIGSKQFWDRLKPEILNARKRVYIQTLSFEGDSVGLDMAQTMIRSDAVDRRIVVDHYSNHIINDRFIYFPGNKGDKELWAEVASTRQMITNLNQNGVQAVFVNPFGWLYCHIPRRNHKKIIVVDDNICYIGGINFSDHNFTWHDMMVRIEDPRVTEFLAGDFLLSCEQKHFGGELEVENMRVISFDGKNNTRLFAPLMDKIEYAQKSIVIHSPYLCQPFTGLLRKASERGVSITVFSPLNNNKIQLQEYIQWESRRSGWDLYLYRDEMLHLKSMLIDDTYLVLGSCNFDYFSRYFEQETIAIITDEVLIGDFKDRVIEKDISRSVKYSGSISPLKGSWRGFQISAIGKIMRLFN